MKKRTKRDILEKAAPKLFGNAESISRFSAWVPVSKEVYEKVFELLSKTKDCKLGIVAVNSEGERGLFITYLDLKELADKADSL